jgi:hypothetical protein
MRDSGPAATPYPAVFDPLLTRPAASTSSRLVPLLMQHARSGSAWTRRGLDAHMGGRALVPPEAGSAETKSPLPALVI